MFAPAGSVLGDGRVAVRVWRRVGLRVGGRKAPNPLDQVGHRSGEPNAQAAFDMRLVFSALGLDKVGQDRGDDPAIFLSLLFASERLTQQRERPVFILVRTSDEAEAAERQGLPARMLRLLGDRERAREPLRRAVNVAFCESRTSGLDEGPWQRRQETFAFGPRYRRIRERLALLDVTDRDENAGERRHGVWRPSEGRQCGAKLLLGRRVFAAIRVAYGEHRPRPAGLSCVADGLGKPASSAERSLRRAVAALDRGDPPALALDLSDRRAVAELVRKAERPLQVAHPFACGTEPPSGVRARSEDQCAGLERTVSTFAGLTRRAQRDISRAR